MPKEQKNQQEARVVIDADRIPGKQRKSFFFNTFDDLKENEEMVILNTHDTSPLKKLFERERPGLFEWTYLKEGPEKWEISIKKKPAENVKISDILLINPEAIFFLADLGIYFYTNLDASIKNLTLNRREDYREIINRAVSHKTGLFSTIRPWIWSVPTIVGYIIENHHQHLHDKLPELRELIKQVNTAFGADFPHLQALESRFTQFIEEITDHLKDEENKIFPFLLAISDQERINKNEQDEIREKMNWIVEDHFLAGDNLQAIRKLCNNYQWNQNMIPGLKVLYKELSELERDFLLHILFENHFLSMAVERRLSQKMV
jgi:regulator of cell morphogenesis and NO signaling